MNKDEYNTLRDAEIQKQRALEDIHRLYSTTLRDIAINEERANQGHDPVQDWDSLREQAKQAYEVNIQRLIGRYRE